MLSSYETQNNWFHDNDSVPTSLITLQLYCLCKQNAPLTLTFNSCALCTMMSDAPRTSPKVSCSILVSLGSSSMRNSSCQWSRERISPPTYLRRGTADSILSTSRWSLTTTAEDSEVDLILSTHWERKSSNLYVWALIDYAGDIEQGTEWERVQYYNT